MEVIFMENAMQTKQSSPLATEGVGKLLRMFAIPAIVGGMVTTLYNITDQIFIGQVVGLNGNAATNVAFPITTLLMALAAMIGFGTAANFNLCQGRGKAEDAKGFLGTGLSLSILTGIILAAVVLVFLKPILSACGATVEVLPYALTYAGITAWGIPFVLFTQANTNLVRADGSPTWAMISSATGAVINIGLDALFMLVFHWGVAGAAAATVVGQIISAVMTMSYFFRFKAFRISISMLKIKTMYLKGIVRLGTAVFMNQFVMLLVQIVMNNTLKHYGAASQYGNMIPLAVVGVVTKLQIILVTVCVGFSMASQPIFSFNYAAKNYLRVRETYLKAVKVIVPISVLFFLAFQIFPDQLVSIFGSGSSDLYFDFARQYMRIFLSMLFIVGIQQITANFFTATGQASKGIFLSLARQGLYLLPLLVILPLFFGLSGVIYAGPIADVLAVTTSLLMIIPELKRLKNQGKENEQ
jgi:putative MATE family efflux protein